MNSNSDQIFVPILGLNLGSVITHLNGNTLNLCPISLSKLYHTLYSQIQYPPIENFLTSHHLLTWQPVIDVKRHAFWSLLEETRFALHLFLLNFQKNTDGDLSPTPNPFFLTMIKQSSHDDLNTKPKKTEHNDRNLLSLSDEANQRRLTLNLQIKIKNVGHWHV